MGNPFKDIVGLFTKNIWGIIALCVLIWAAIIFFTLALGPIMAPRCAGIDFLSNPGSGAFCLLGG